VDAFARVSNYPEVILKTAGKDCAVPSSFENDQFSWRVALAPCNVLNSLPSANANALYIGVFCLSSQKPSFQIHGCKSRRKKIAFRAYVLRRQNWRKPFLRLHVAKLLTFAIPLFRSRISSGYIGRALTSSKFTLFFLD
jgi:hypothetical protein